MIKQFKLELENDSIGQKTILRLEPFPLSTPMLDKGKGVVFEFQHKHILNKKDDSMVRNKLMGDVIKAGMTLTMNPIIGCL